SRVIASGCYHTCAVVAGNNGHCWGRHDHGQTTLPAGRAGQYLKFVVGDTHSCALFSDLTVQCWGTISVYRSSTHYRDIASSRSAVYGIRFDTREIVAIAGSIAQVPVGMIGFASLTAGGNNLCALHLNGSASRIDFPWTDC